MKHQSPKVRNRLAVKLAQYTVLMAFTIGFFLSSIHVLEDYKTQGSRLDQTVIDILDASKPPATRAVHTLDQALAQEVVNGLMQYPFISKVQIRDELGEVLAEQESTLQKTKTQWLTEAISTKYKDYALALRAPGFANLEPGSLQVVVDQDLALQPFFERALTTFVSGVVRNILLAVFLIALFHAFLTKPLALLAKQFAELRLEDSEGKYLEVPEQHKNTELGQLSDVGNEFIHTAQKLLHEKKSNHLALVQSEHLLKQVINQAPQLIVALNSKDQVLFCNQQVAEFYDVSVESLVGVTISDFHSFQDEVERMHVIRRSVEANNAPVDITEFSWSRENGEQLHFSIQASPFEYFSEPATLVVATDITSQKVVQDHISHIANHDNLTGLPNRVLLNDRLSRSILSCERNGVYNALLFIDLDHFKTINDSLGHGIGDLLLKEVAEILIGQVRANDTVARLGGDEFVVLLEFLHDNQERIKADVQIICDKLLEILSQPIDIKQHKLRIGASIGVVIFPIEGKDIDDLMRFADTAMYHAKENGRNGYAFYHRSMSLAVEKQQHMENELHRALEQEEFRIHYQPLVNVTGAIVGFEALIRWQHPEKGLMPPIEFIPSLEISGMIVPVSNWLLAKCSRQIEKWKAEGFWQDGWYTSINISPLQFYQADMVITLQQAIVGGGANLSDICLEITETVAVENIEFAKSRLQKIRKLGITIALDDFGTGYSSLSYLKDLPIDIVKIDRSFIQELGAHNNSRSIVEAVASIAKAYNLVVLAEGIETKEQLEIAHNIGCHVFQGFYIERPQAAEQLQNEYLSKGL
ncbi:bifunctional diguanylate cyclase/phosphodiesterase [Neptuniibacter sp. 2_MG-2023]|uniref:putative bifunctional diguanylate cyclase/phosphodiesterase n=1 Tax=Neptuniibacter sp. 2_MG-2023 TaxID=3062671 RepID=UPI0026E19BC5|nr:bifunctional diguanylate cyclase/phosphodiesterase [Neptuniibacter sp. 2_MG-2023]MDO6512745.1 EAL domain-containing protein [Neptuniibacter sp. 2_MG-2023]